jgi:antitoxin CptB
MDTGEYARIRWRCRRGLLELDLMLIPFAEREYGSLSAHERSAFARLLDYPDPKLLGILVHQGEDPEPGLTELVNKIRKVSEN